MYTLKSIARRGTPLGAAIALILGAIAPAVLPAMSAYADALNPLTKRSLTLSSSSPGWSHVDGSGNSTYAPPNSGANGKQTGNTFEFHNSTDTSTGSDKIKSMSFQYCTASAGACTSPGNDSLSSTPGTDDATHSDLNYVSSSPSEVGASDFSTVVDSATGAVKAVPGVTDPLTSAGHPLTTGQYAAHAVSGNFIVMRDVAGTWTQSTGWTMSVESDETGAVSPTHKNNFLVLTNTTGLGLAFDSDVKVVFFGTTNNYLTNPGEGAFFVKINTYKVPFDDSSPVSPAVDMTGLEPATDTNVLDGGVTVANVMNQSIQITTKVLETMDFSVGTFDPDTQSSTKEIDGTTSVAAGDGNQSAYELAEGITNPNDSTTLHATHGPCDGILTGPTPTSTANVLQLGDQAQESSLSTTHTYSTHSYWRLSSNSSGGATVYYSGHTLSNTEGDQIAPAGSVTAGDGIAVAPHHGEEQFGLAIDNGGSAPYALSYAQEATYENADDNNMAFSTTTTTDNSSNASYHAPKLAPLAPTTNYGGGTGNIDGSSPTTSFAFDLASDTVPAAIATESTNVVDCVSAKMRYMANIAATTPAGIYTTKINYIAAPQY